MTKIEEKVREFCLTKGLLDTGDSVVVGLSGGADSVCLLFILLDMKKELDLEVSAIHVNHGIRGNEAQRDEDFCHELCHTYKVPFKCVKVDVPAIAKQRGESIEEAGRNIRYEEYNIYADVIGANKIAVAHNRNDVAETFMFQLFRGSRLTGLSGIRPMNGRIIRPILQLTRKEIEQYLSGKRQGYVVDSTNQSLQYSRNFIRNKILPSAEELQPRALEHITSTADYLARVTDYVDKQADKLYELCVDDFMGEAPAHIDININMLKNGEYFLSEIVIYKVICKVAGRKKDITSEAVESCLALLDKQSGRSIDLKYGLMVKRSYSKLIFTRKSLRSLGRFTGKDSIDNSNANCNNFVIEEYDVPEGIDGLEYVYRIGGFPRDLRSRLFDKEDFVEHFGAHYVMELRSVASDDYIVVFEDGRRKRVVEVLSDAKIPEDDRQNIKVVAVGSEVLIIPGIRTSETCRVHEETIQIMKLTLTNREE